MLFTSPVDTRHDSTRRRIKTPIVSPLWSQPRDAYYRPISQKHKMRLVIFATKMLVHLSPGFSALRNAISCVCQTGDPCIQLSEAKFQKMLPEIQESLSRIMPISSVTTGQILRAKLQPRIDRSGPPEPHHPSVISPSPTLKAKKTEESI